MLEWYFLHLNSEVSPHTFVLRGYILLAKPSPCFLVYVALFRDGKFLLFVIKYEDWTSQNEEYFVNASKAEMLWVSFP